MSRFPQVFVQKQGAGRVKGIREISDKPLMVKWNRVVPKIEKLYLRAFAFAMLCFYSSIALSQAGIDPSSALLLNSGTRAPERVTPDRNAPDSRLESGRYTVRPRDRNSEKPVPTPSARKQTAGATETARTAGATEPTPTAATVVAPINEQGVVAIANPEIPVDTPDPIIIDSRGGNLLEIAISTAFLYDNSSSSFSYRRYSVAAPAYSADARVWLSSEFGVGGSYLSSLGATVGDGGNDTAVTKSDTTVGLFFRKSIGEEKDLSLGLEFVDFQFRVPSDSANRLKTKSSGVRVSVRGDWGDFRLGFSIAPKLQHEESSTSAAVQSGGSVEAYRVGFMVERRWMFDRSNSIFLRMQHEVEQNTFTGTASSPDQMTGLTPNGVGVTQGTTVIQFGYDWGQ